MPPADTLGSRLRTARKAARLTLADVALHFEHSEAAIQQWEGDKTLPSPDKIVRFARLTGADLLWVMTGTRQGESKPPSADWQAAEGAAQAIPKLSLQDALRGQPKGKCSSKNVTFPQFPCSGSAFAIVILDNSNAPRFEPGDQVVIDPQTTPLPGDMVLALIAGEPLPLFRKYRIESGVRSKSTVLEPLNEDWPREVALQSKIRLLGVMTEHTKPRR
jgi:HTH-type transcriptional regulator, cell division transcriptional repressor